MFPLNTLSVLEFSGHDAGQFLHDQLSADIIGIAIGDAGFACCCNPAGRVISLLLAAPRADSVLVVCASELADPLKAWLGKYILRADVQISRRSDLTVAAWPADSFSAESGANKEAILQTAAGLAYAITAAPGRNVPHGSPEAQAWKEAELNAGVVWLGTQSSAKFLPQMLGFESIGALSFKKGCFPGQEIIARTRYLGTLKRRPLRVRIDSTVPVGVMEKVALQVDAERHGGIVVDLVSAADGDQTLFIVVRAPADIRPESVTIRGKKNRVRYK